MYLDLHPGMQDDDNPRILANDRIYPFAMKYHDDVPYLSNHDKYTINYDAAIVWQREYTKILERNAEKNDLLPEDYKNYTTDICQNSLTPIAMPEYFVLRYYHPSNLMLKKIEKFLDHPFIMRTNEEGDEEKVELLSYK